MAAASSRSDSLACRVLVLALFRLAIVAAFVLAGVWGAGSSVMPLAAKGALGTPSQETTIRLVAYSSAPTGIGAFALVLWGLRLTGIRRD
jgi:hydroxylaminobenzene mutase